MKLLIFVLLGVFLYNLNANAAICNSYDKELTSKIEKLLSTKRYVYSVCASCEDKGLKSYQAQDFVFNKEGRLVFAVGADQGKVVDLSQIYVEVEHNQVEKVAAKVACPQYKKDAQADPHRRIAMDLLY